MTTTIANPSSSVYMDTLEEDCFRFKIYFYSSCYEQVGQNLVKTSQADKCTIFTLESQKMFKGPYCITGYNGGYAKVKISSGCLTVRLDQNNRIHPASGGGFTNFYGKYFGKTGGASNSYKAVQQKKIQPWQ